LINEKNALNAFSISLYNLELDNQAGFHSFGRRWYQSNYGRFVSPDPKNGSPEDPLSWNRYLYCNNDPINRLDPDGKAGHIIVLLDEKAMGGEGHIAVAVGPVEDGKYVYYSFDARNNEGILKRISNSSGPDRGGVREYNSMHELLQAAGPDGLGYTNYARIDKTDEQTKEAKNTADEEIGGHYDLSQNNCATFVRNVIESVDVITTGTNSPIKLFNEAADQANKVGTLPIEKRAEDPGNENEN
jgi:RHS repeat-associated protein